MNSNNKRSAALERGKRGEWIATLSLRMRGYRIRARNFRTKSGEIDIIAQKGDLIAIVEVKARNIPASAVEAVDLRSQHRITNAANIWLSRQKNYADLSLRFDIIAMVPWFGIGALRPVYFCDAF